MRCRPSRAYLSRAVIPLAASRCWARWRLHLRRMHRYSRAIRSISSPNILAWIVLFIAPVIAITVFWMVHILPEKIAEKRHHPQAHAIKTLCLLSLFFGGLLWPLAWLWAYSKPVLYKIAYGTDVVKPDEHEPPARRRSGGLRAPTSQRCREPRRTHTINGSRRSDMELLLLGIYSFFVWLIFFKYKCCRGTRSVRSSSSLCRSSASRR